MRAIFESPRYAVETTDTADEVAQLAHGKLSHVIILDLLLAGKDDRNTIRQLKSQERIRFPCLCSQPILTLNQQRSRRER